MTKYHPGQRVKVTGTIVAGPFPSGDYDVAMKYKDVNGGKIRVVETTVHGSYIEDAPEDPVADPIGTVREEVHGDGHSTWVRMPRSGGEWMCVDSTAEGNVGQTLRSDEIDISWRVIGAVPGTPAAMEYGHLNGGVS